MGKYESIELKRKELFEHYKKDQFYAFIFTALAIGSFILLFLFGEYSFSIIFIIGIIVFGILAGIRFAKTNKVATQFKTFVKNELVDKILGTYFDEYKYFENQHIPINQINGAGLIKTPDRYFGEDLIVGKYKNIEFKVSDIKMQERQVVHTKNGTTVTYVPYFTGRWYVYRFPKKFDHILKIIEKRNGADVRGLSKYETEMVEFNKKFSIFASDQQFFYYMITPYMIERLLLLEQAHRGHIAYAMIGDELHIGINDNSDSLELSFKREINESSILHFEEDIKLIKDIVDELYLDDIKFR